MGPPTGTPLSRYASGVAGELRRPTASSPVWASGTPGLTDGLESTNPAGDLRILTIFEFGRSSSTSATGRNQSPSIPQPNRWIQVSRDRAVATTVTISKKMMTEMQGTHKSHAKITIPSPNGGQNYQPYQLPPLPPTVWTSGAGGWGTSHTRHPTGQVEGSVRLTCNRYAGQRYSARLHRFLRRT